jgi:signal transduction histidine kinase
VRIRQLKQEIETRQNENEKVIADNLAQNEKLRVLNEELTHFNQDLENKVKERTSEVEASKQHLEDQAEQLLELNKTKEALTHMIVHDMKNPLTVVMGTLRLLEKKDLGLEPMLKEFISDSHYQAKVLFRMMEEMLFISRMQTKEFQLKLEATDLVRLLTQAVNNMSRTTQAKKVELVFTPPRKHLEQKVDGDMIERIVNNLLNNSIKYAPNNSKVTVDLAQEDNRVLITVTNVGEPIPAEYHTKIFELFARVNAKDKQLSGTGLGLAFCKLAVEAHHGTIAVVSPLPGRDRGTAFTVALPLEIP